MIVVGGIPDKILIFTDRAHVKEDTAYAILRARQTLWREPFVRGHAPPRWGLMSRVQRGITTHRVLPQDVNHLGTLFGGRLMEWMDGAAEIAAARYAQRVVVTVAMEQVTFTRSVQVGDRWRWSVPLRPRIRAGPVQPTRRRYHRRDAEEKERMDTP